MKDDTQGTVNMVVNGHTLTGIKRAGQWRWHCDSFPELARKYSGRAEPWDMISHFLDLGTRTPAEDLPAPRRGK